MTGITKMKDSIINGVFGRKEHVVEGIVVGDACGSAPRFIWEPSRKGISVRTKGGKMVRVYLKTHTLSPADALGWSYGDTLRIRGKVLESKGNALVFSSALLEIGG